MLPAIEWRRLRLSMTQLVLSLFPGIGLLDRAFEEQGFCVVRGPDLLWGGDVEKFNPPANRFDGIIGGPPCQFASPLSAIARSNGQKAAVNKIPEFERIVSEATPLWFLMENVKEAPEPNVSGYAVKSILLNNRWFGAEQNRVRRFSFGVLGEQAINLWSYIEVAALECINWSPTVLCRNQYKRPVKNRKSRKVELKYTGSGPSRKSVLNSLRLQGLAENFFEHSPFTVEGQQRVIGNGVPLPLGRAVAKAVFAALNSNGGGALLTAINGGVSAPS